MTNKNTKGEEIYEDAEIVQEGGQSKGARFGQSRAQAYARNTADKFHRQILYSSLGTIFIFLFALFVGVALVLTVLFWLLPFAIAALILTALIALVIAGYQSIRNFFSNK
ncbi:MAG: hypothetical protein ACKKL4_01735 [Patescibacteria group bacterium]